MKALVDVTLSVSRSYIPMTTTEYFTLMFYRHNEDGDMETQRVQLTRVEAEDLVKRLQGQLDAPGDFLKA